VTLREMGCFRVVSSRLRGLTPLRTTYHRVPEALVAIFPAG
jgi:hypothetical protein